MKAYCNISGDSKT